MRGKEEEKKMEQNKESIQKKQFVEVLSKNEIQRKRLKKETMKILYNNLL